MTRRKKVVWLIIALASLTTFLSLIPVHYNFCSVDEARQEHCSSYQLIPFVLLKTAKFLDAAGGTITALATIAIALFTWTLWQSSEKLWLAGKEAMQATNRAFVFIDCFDYELTVASDRADLNLDSLPTHYRDCPELCITRFAVLPRWKNSGTTPTKFMVVWTKHDGINRPVFPDFENNFSGQLFFLAPQSTAISEVVEISGARALVDWSFNPVGLGPEILIYGRAAYDDVFGGEHFIEWCYELRFSRPSKERMHPTFIQRGEYCRVGQRRSEVNR